MHEHDLTLTGSVTSLLGGALIGLGASLLYGSTGRTAGASGILAGLLRPRPADWPWRSAFLLGLFIAGTMMLGAARESARPVQNSSLWLLIPSGICVGFGSRLAGGCTSGHGVCGISRLSLRSIVATLTFIVAGAITVLLLRHLRGGHA